MAEFPALQPEFRASRNNNVWAVSMTGGTLKSAAGLTPEIDADFVSVGHNYLRGNADMKHCRPDAHGVLKTKDGALLYLRYTGVLTMGPEEIKGCSRQAGDGDTPFGNAFIIFTIETGHQRYQELENRVFVGQGRFRVQGGKTSMEYRVSQAVKD